MLNMASIGEDFFVFLIKKKIANFGKKILKLEKQIISAYLAIEIFFPRYLAKFFPFFI